MEPAPKKITWADMTDDDPLPLPEEPPIVISKHGIKVRQQDKTKPLVESK